MKWRLLIRLATDLPISQYRSLRRGVLSFHPHSLDINCHIGGVVGGGSTGTNTAECGRTEDKVWQIFTLPTPPPAQAEAKAQVCWATVNDPFLGKKWPFESLATF